MSFLSVLCEGLSGVWLQNLTLADLATLESVSPDAHAALQSSATWIQSAAISMPKFKLDHDLCRVPVTEIKMILHTVVDLSVANFQMIHFPNRHVAAAFARAVERARALAQSSTKESCKSKILAAIFHWDAMEVRYRLENAEASTAPSGIPGSCTDDFSQDVFFDFEGQQYCLTLGWSEESRSLLLDMVRVSNIQHEDIYEKAKDVDVFEVCSCGAHADELNFIDKRPTMDDPRKMKDGLLCVCIIREMLEYYKDY